MMEESASSKGPVLPPFLTKCYDMVEDPATDPIVSWSSSNYSFVIWDMTAFSRDLLPKYFKHSNFSSFMRQLNTYGFRKADPDRWEFVNDGFVKGQRHLLKNISRKKHNQCPVQQKESQQKIPVGACVEVGKLSLQEAIESLKKDKTLLMQELVKLKQHQQTSEDEVHCLRKRLEGMEKAQQQMLSFLAMAMQSPGFLEQLLQQNENSWFMAGTSKKRRLATLEQVTEGAENEAFDGQIVMYQPPKNETSRPIVMTTSNTNVSPNLGSSPSEIEDIVKNVDSMALSMGEMSDSPENDASFVIPDFLYDHLLEQFLLDSPLVENLEEIELDAPEPMSTGIEMKSSLPDSQHGISQSMDLQMEEQGLLASEANNRYEILYNNSGDLAAT
ncbi:PREDICTED: heat stress transcription factor A-1-like [Nelumbo nucifera]|uniref:Heat stress transcription factor A-1-like n=2 Tax=Nelumbo nucifera TaxID=4432 RepID=A0A1U8AX34_NELNU|nr:PREDICTED: heat stress transcription factor A-1-like [Nelumbo nucifera]DAD32272.1 TPA_asm: hypothetical protein HUJ06_011123 [Nelumbo nucifera]